MKRGLIIGAVLAALWIGAWGCSRTKEASKGVENTGTLPPVAVEASQAQARDLIEGMEVVGSLTPKLEARLKAEYSGDRRRGLCHRMGAGEKRNPPGQAGHP